MLLDAHYPMRAPSHLNSSRQGFLTLFYVPAIEIVTFDLSDSGKILHNNW